MRDAFGVERADVSKVLSPEKKAQAKARAKKAGRRYPNAYDNMIAGGADFTSVNKDMGSTVRWTTKAGKKVSLKAKAAPVKAQVKAMNAGERIAASAPKKATRTRKTLRRIAGKAIESAAYRPDSLALAATRTPSLVQLAA
jgi:hypothetical protein